MSLSLLNGKFTAGRRTVSQIKVTGFNIFRDFRFQNNQKFKSMFAIFRDHNRPKFVCFFCFFFNEPTATLVSLILTCQGNSQVILIPELISVNMICAIRVFKVGEKEMYSSKQIQCIFS